MFEPSQITINTKLDLTDDSLNRSKDSKRKHSPRQSFERINSQEFKQQLDLIVEEPGDQQINIGSQQNMASSSPNSSEILSKMAVLDNQNPIDKDVQYPRVKGHKKLTEEDFQPFLRDDIIMKGLSQSELERQHQASQKFTEDLFVVKALQQHLKQIENIELANQEKVKRYFKQKGLLLFETLGSKLNGPGFER